MTQLSAEWNCQLPAHFPELRHLFIIVDEAGDLTHTWHRVKATLERAQRLTQAYTDSLLGVLPAMADRMGNALGIEAERQQVEQSASAVVMLPSL